MPEGLPQTIDEPQPFGVAFDEQPEVIEPEQAPIVGMAPEPIPLLDLPGADEPPPIDPGLVAQADELALAAPPVEPDAFGGEIGQAPGVLPPGVVPTPEIGAAPVEFPDFAPAPAEADMSPLASAAAQNDAVRASQDAVSIATAENAELVAQHGRLIRVFPTAKPAQQRKLAAKIGEVERAIASSNENVATTREDADVEQAVQEGELGLAVNRERQTAMANAQVDVDRAQAEQDAKLLESRDREAEATTQRDESIATYQREMSAGPSRSVGVMMADILTESLNARKEKRTPNFGGALARHEKETASIFARKQNAALAGIKASGDKIADLAAGRRLMKAEGLERDAAIMARAASEAERRIGIATTDAQEAQATGLRDDLVKASEEKRAQAAVARGKYLQGQRDDDLDRQLKQANIAKAQAAAGKTELEADKLRKKLAGGGGPAKVLETGLIAANVVAVPGTRETLATFEDTPKGHKEAATTRDVVNKQQAVLNAMANMEATLEDASAQGLLKSITKVGSTANVDFMARRAAAVKSMAAFKAGVGFAASEGDNKWAEEQLPGDPKSWTNRERSQGLMRAMRTMVKDDARLTLGGKTRIDPGKIERMISQSDKRAISQAKRGRALARKAQQGALDKTKSTAERIKNVEMLEDNARLDAHEGGGDWIPQAAAQISDVTLKTDDPEVENAGFDKITKMQRFLEGRIAQRVNLLGAKAKFAPGMESDRQQLKKLEADRLKIAEKKLGQARDLLSGE